MTTATEKRSVEKKKSSSSDAKQFIEDQIRAAKFTRSEIIAAYLEKFSDRQKSTVQTYLSDAKNRKFTAFSYLAKEDKKSKIFSFTNQKVVYNYYRKKK